MGVWIISDNNILQTDFEGKSILERKYQAKKIMTLKNYLSWRIMLGINPTPLYIRKKVLGLGKKFLQKANHPDPRPKVKLLVPK